MQYECAGAALLRPARAPSAQQSSFLLQCQLCFEQRPWKPLRKGRRGNDCAHQSRLCALRKEGRFPSCMFGGCMVLSDDFCLTWNMILMEVEKAFALFDKGVSLSVMPAIGYRLLALKQRRPQVKTIDWQSAHKRRKYIKNRNNK
eukprot:scaffold84992_cov17-Tisochrysis_lutea.AAC.1